MPLPRTNKNTVTRISKIVAVQTGIPTSLIDLFLNNKNHFKSPNSNKPIRRQIPDTPPPPPPSFSSSPESPSSSDYEAPTLTPALLTGNLNGNDGVIQVGESGNGSGSKTLFGGFLKILVIVVVIAIASVEKLTVGISVSAFMLLFFEYLAKRVVFCSNANVEVIKDCVWFQKFPLRIKKNYNEVPEQTTIVCNDDNIVLSDLVVGAECSSPNSLSFDEIEVVETNMCSEETSCVEPKLGCSEFDMQKDSNSNSNSNGEKVVDSCKVKGSSRSDKKFKSKMKKLLPKKLKGSSKKEGKEKRGNKEHEAETNIEEKSENLLEIEEEENSGSKSPPLLKIEYVTEKEVDREVNFCQEFSVERVEEVVIVNSEERKLSRVGKSSGCIVLSVIALVGLVLGRFPAFILIITWCFMLKIVGRSMLPFIKSSVIPNS